MKKLLLTLFASCAALMVACAGDSQGGRVANAVRVALVGGADACAPSARIATGLWERAVPCRVDAYAVAGGGVLAGQDEKNDVYSQLTRVFSSGTNYGMVVVWCSDEAVPSGDALQTQFRRLTALVREKAPRCSLVLFTPCELPLNAEKDAARKALAAALFRTASGLSVSILDFARDIRFPAENAAAHFAAGGTALSEKGYAFVGDWQAKYLRYIHSVGWGVDPAFVHPKAEQERMARRTQRLHDARWGVFNHYLGHEVKTAAAWEAKVKSFDVKKVADQLEAVGARFYFITLMQGRRWMCAPNATYDRIAGTKPGEACSTRDLPMELAAELARRNIDLYLYYTGDGPYLDKAIGPRFGYTEPRFVGVTRPFVEKWASVLEEYAVRYGDRVKGWWIDGCFADYLCYTDDLLAPYRAAILKGNPEALVAMNNGVKDCLSRYTPHADFTAGELNDFYCVPPRRFIDGAQAFALIPLGAWGPDGSPNWGGPGAKRTADYVADYVRLVNANGGVVAIDVKVKADGSWLPEQIEVLKAVGHAAGTLNK